MAERNWNAAIRKKITGGMVMQRKTIIAGIMAVAVLILGVIRNGLTLMSVSSDYQQWITGFLLLLSVLISEIRVRKTGTLMK